MSPQAEDYVTSVLSEVQGYNPQTAVWDPFESAVRGLVEVGMLQDVGATAIMANPDRTQRMGMLQAALAVRPTGAAMPSPPFARSARDTTRRAPLGFEEKNTGENFFTLAGVQGATTTMTAKVSRTAHADRLLIVPSAPGAALQSIKVGDEEQLLSSGAPVELYSVQALTDSLPDNFSPLGGALDFVVVLINTGNVVITGTIGIKAACDR